MGTAAGPVGLLPRRKALLAIGLIIALAISLATLPARTASPQATVELCLAEVEPCQRVVNLPVGGMAYLDLFLNSAATGDGSDPQWLVAWESHFRLTDSSPVHLEEAPETGEPVREQGSDRYALEGLTRLGAPSQEQADEAAAQYFSVQNRYDVESGQLDYAVTLLRLNPVEPAPKVLPFADQNRLLLGRIGFKGVAPGSVDLVGDSSTAIPFQAIGLNQSDQLNHLAPEAFNNPLATLNIVPVGGMVELVGQVARRKPADLVISFWEPRALPPWQEGVAAPLAIFYDVGADAGGIFRIPDVSPSVLPSGTYDVRVKGRNTLARLVPEITIPEAVSDGIGPTVVTIFPGELRDGDIDGSHAVDRLDILALKAGFGRLAGQAGYDDRADFNQDNLGDSQDFSRLAANYPSRSE